MDSKLTALQKFSVGFSIAVGALVVIMIVAFGGAEEKRVDRTRDEGLTDIKLQRMAREFVLGTLRDPGSAQFRNQRGGCGEVNAKNSFGGYPGYRRFIAASKELVFIEGENGLSGAEFQTVWDRVCK